MDSTPAASDPNLYWDGHRWLRWDGQVWRDTESGESLGPSQPQAEALEPLPEGSFAAPGYYRTNMTAVGVLPGMLVMTPGPDGRLTFTSDGGTVVFDGPLASFHSLGLTEWDSALEVWQGADRHRVCMTPGGPIAGNIAGAYAGNTEASRWLAVLQPAVGSPPAGVEVKKPMGRAGYTWMTVGIVVGAIIVAILVVVLIG